MDEAEEYQMRSLVATVSAQDFLIDFLLTQAFVAVPEAERSVLANVILEASKGTEQFRGVAKDEFQAERMADVGIQSQQHIDRAIRRALGRAIKDPGGTN
jgi:hypothetical protein